LAPISPSSQAASAAGIERKARPARSSRLAVDSGMWRSQASQWAAERARDGIQSPLASKAARDRLTIASRRSRWRCSSSTSSREPSDAGSTAASLSIASRRASNIPIATNSTKGV
jgi:hypothetical protein